MSARTHKDDCSHNCKGSSGVIEIPDLDAILAELQPPSSGPKDTFTMTEWQEHTGRGVHYLRKRFGILKKAGRLFTSPVYRESLEGRMVKVPAYGIKQ